MYKDSYKWLCENLRAGKTVYRKTYIDRNPATAKNSFEMQNEKISCIIQENGERVLYERFCSEKIAIVCGGGHISIPITKICKILGYKIFVIDDRKEFAIKKRFENADFVIHGDFKNTLSKFEWEKYSDISVIIVTRGHTADIECLREVINKDLTYVGMIGSKKKNEAIFSVLKNEGVFDNQLKKIFAPIGLKIGAQTPEEIAVSIAAQLVEQRKDIKNGNIDENMINAICSDIKGVVATVVSKTGSAPRNIGARMIRLENGDVFGSIGGGLAEYLSLEKMKNFKESSQNIHFFDMSNGEAGKSGMICGGRIEVLFEII